MKSSGAVVYGLPGNPVSSFMCLNVYVQPWLKRCIGQEASSRRAVLESDVSFKPNLTYFLEVAITQSEDGRLVAQPRRGNGSGDLANLVTADAFLELPKGKDIYEKGSIYNFIAYR